MLFVFFFFLVFGGRGIPAEVQTAIDSQTAYLSRMQTLVRDYVTELGARKSELADAQKAPAHYQEITRRAQAAFPDYELPYMVEYGVYGLVNAVAGL